MIREYGEIILSYNLTERIVFFDDIDDIDLAMFYSCAKALCICSLYEGFCIPAVEALSCGIEVIATDIPAIREICLNNVHYYEVDNLKKMCELVKKAFKGSLKQRNFLFKNSFSWESASLCLEQIFLEDLNKGVIAE